VKLLLCIHHKYFNIVVGGAKKFYEMIDETGGQIVDMKKKIQ
jgi:hypothetical protein